MQFGNRCHQTTAHAAGGLKKALAAYVKPEVLCIDELGYLPVDKFGADCLVQIISHRCKRGSTVDHQPPLQAM